MQLHEIEVIVLLDVGEGLAEFARRHRNQDRRVQADARSALRNVRSNATGSIALALRKVSTIVTIDRISIAMLATAMSRKKTCSGFVNNAETAARMASPPSSIPPVFTSPRIWRLICDPTS